MDEGGGSEDSEEVKSYGVRCSRSCINKVTINHGASTAEETHYTGEGIRLLLVIHLVGVWGCTVLAVTRIKFELGRTKTWAGMSI